MHSEFKDGDPYAILAMCQAANELSTRRANLPRDDDGFAVIMQIFCFRAAAVGWREAAQLFEYDYKNKKPKNARYDRRVCLRYATEADKDADKLCGSIGLVFEFVGSYQSSASIFWKAFKHLYTEVNDSKLVWRLVAASGEPEEWLGIPSELARDEELMWYSQFAGETMFELMNSQISALRKAKPN